MTYTFIDSPVGQLLVLRDEEGIRSISFDVCVECGNASCRCPMPRSTAATGVAALHTRDDARFADVRSQLRAYFAKELRVFNLPLAPRGTAFQLDVWRALRAIPYGETRSYSQVAQVVGRPDAVRAVGAANGANPLPIVVPCHRVIGANGSLTGFGGGLEAKQFLLGLEGGRPVRLF